jgi:hypothetical protein
VRIVPTAETPAAARPVGAGDRVRSTARSAGGWLRANWQPIAAIAIFCGVAVLIFGGNPFSTSALPQCACGDTAQEVWFLAWPAHALAHGANPFFTDAAAYPRGLDLMSSTSMPLLGVLAAPVTLTLGPVAAFNLMARLAFVFSGTSMLFVLRRYVRWWPAAFAGAFLFGFSPFMFAQGYTHLFLTFLPLPPLVFLLLDELLVRQVRRPARTGAVLGLVLVAQLLISAEVLTITVLVAVATVVLLVARHPVAARERAGRVLSGIGAAALVFAVLGAYPLWAYAAGPQHVTGLQHPAGTYYLFHDDLLGVLFPNVLQRFRLPGLSDSRGNGLLQGNGVEHALYLGIPLLAFVLYVVVRYRRTGVVVIGGAVAAASLVLALGPRLYVDGTLRFASLRLPYDALLHLPLLKGILAPRFAIGIYLGVALVLAFGLDRLRADGLGLRRSGAAIRASGDGGRASGVRRALAATAAGAVAVVPTVPASYLRGPLPVPALFTSPALLDRIPAGSVVLPYPQAQIPDTAVPVAPDVRSMLWQAVAGMRFKMIGAYAAQPSGRTLGQGDALFDAPTDVQHLFGWALYGAPSVSPVAVTPAVLDDLRTFCVRYDVSTILVDPTVGVHPLAVVDYVSSALGREPERTGGLDAWFDVAGTLGAGTRATVPTGGTDGGPSGTSTTTAAPSTTTPAATTTTVDPGTLPQTTAFPSATAPQFDAEMRDLWRGIVSGSLAAAMPSFFPRTAYLQVKAVADPGADYQDRLVAEFGLDLAASHDYLGAGAAGARLVRVEVASSEATWIDPGGCYNRTGYWHAPGARLVYEEGGVQRSIGIASLISWRGTWYVVHLGAVLRPASGGGVVDDPAAGSGTLPPPGGC